LEEQILQLYLNLLIKLFKFFIIIIGLFSFYLIHTIFHKTILENERIVIVDKGSNLSLIIDNIMPYESEFNKKIYYFYLIFYDHYFKSIKYGEYQLKSSINFHEITKIISNKSNYYRNFTIIGGWQQYQIKQYIFEEFKKDYQIDYNLILADTYNYFLNDDFLKLKNLMKKYKENYFENKNNNILLKKYSQKEILIIASLVEKEGKTDKDKRLISSVILNRLDKKMKLEIDATTIYAITKGKYKLERKLNYSDLKIVDEYNTYYIKGLPPNPICFVSRKTIEIVLENYKSDYLFYFYNEKIGEHIFTKTFDEHKKKLREYRTSE
tara:strand:+ start:1498 stop:2469 length:972 start_codon:yes stop_codon:yes gene_type:complete